MKKNCKTPCKFKNKSRFVSGMGSKRAKLMIVGEYPDKTECCDKQPFCGEGGGILNWVLGKTGIVEPGENRYKKIYFTTAIKCYPSPVKNLDITDRDFKPFEIKAEHLDSCRSILDSEIRSIKPKFIVTLGAKATQTVLRDKSFQFEKRIGYWIWSKEFKAWVMPAPNPSNVFSKWEHTPSFVKCFEHVKKAYIDKEKISYKLGKYTLAKTFKEALAICDLLEESKTITFDTETTSLAFWNPKEEIIGFSASNKAGKGYWIPFLHQTKDDGTRVPSWNDKQRKKLIGRLKSILENPKIKKIAQNGKFDISVLRVEGIKVDNLVWDTYQVQHLIDENTPNNLTFQAQYHNTGLPNYDIEVKPYIRTIDDKKRYEYVPEDIIGTYGAADADATFRVYNEQKKLTTKRINNLYNNYSILQSKVCREMEWKGVLVAVDRIDELKKEYQIKIDKENKELAKLCKVESINVASPKQLQHLLFEKFKLKIIERTKTGLPGTGESVITKLLIICKKRKKICKILTKILEIRKMRKMQGTYLEGFRKLVDHNNRVHTSYNTTGTVTARLSSSNPNLQNIPRDPIFRSLMIAGFPVYVFLPADYSQIEARLIAVLAKDTKLILKFAEEGFDIHTYNAQQALGKEDITKEERSDTKPITFGMNYGQTEKGIAENNGLDIEFVKEFLAGYFKAYPNIKKFRDKCISDAQENGYLETPSGRRRHFHGFEWAYSSEMDTVVELKSKHGLPTWMVRSVIGGMERQAMNFPVQSYAHDILLKAQGRVRKAFRKQKLDAVMAMEVHDATIPQAARKDAKKALIIIKKEMPVTIKVKKGVKMEFPIDVSIEKHWVQ